MGVVSPVGNDLETTWNNLINGVCGIAPITSFDTTDLPVKIAGELKDFDPIASGVVHSFPVGLLQTPSAPSSFSPQQIILWSWEVVSGPLMEAWPVVSGGRGWGKSPSV